MLLKLKHIFLLGFIFFGLNPIIGQNTNWLLDTSYNNLDWDSFVEKTEAAYDLRFFYQQDLFVNIKLSEITETILLSDYLLENLESLGIIISYNDPSNIFLHKNNTFSSSLPLSIYEQGQIDPKDVEGQSKKESDFVNTSSEFLAKKIIIGNVKDGVNKKTITLSGYLYDLETKNPIIGGTCLIQELGIGAASDEKGFYSLTAPKGSYTLIVNELTHLELKAKVELVSDGTYDFFLENKANVLDEVVITSEEYDEIRNTKMGFERLTTKSIKALPMVLGERDILKVATLLSGVQTVGEGASGFNVRGSPADQNLFYIDKVPIYNTSHLFGFFSAFNSEAISEFSLAKSNIPAKFGGRLASVFDITALEGNKQKYKLRGGISPITGNLLFEGPIQKDKSSVMIGLRSTYSNWIFRLIKNEDFKNTKANFGDAVMKLSFDLNPRNKIQAFGYFSFDQIDFASRTKFDNDNIGSSVSWTHYLKNSGSLNVSAIYSKIVLDVENEETAFDAYRQKNALEHKELRTDLTFYPFDKHKFTAGANAILYDNNRGNFNPLGPLSLLESTALGTERGLESGLYISDEWAASDRFTLTTGLRYNRYSYLGPQAVLQYEENGSKIPENVIDTLSFGNNETIKTYQGLDLRLAARYVVNPSFSIKASYNTLHQYIFLLSNTIALAPTDKWKLTDFNIRPMTGHQFAFGMYTNFFEKKLEFTVEPYYKKVQQLVEYRDGAELLINENPEQDVLQGELDAFGIELVLKKPKGQLSGWLNYTYSNARALVNQEETGELINFGASYPTNYDKPHALNLVANYKFSRRVSLSTNLVYSTGKPITYPSSVYLQNSIQVINYTNRNEFRVPDYFRMDLSVKVEGNLKSKKLLHSSWVFSVYNLTGRKNAYSVFFASDSGRLSGNKVSIFAVPIFSLSYNFKFGNYDN